jgi:hypothetical protein
MATEMQMMKEDSTLGKPDPYPAHRDQEEMDKYNSWIDDFILKVNSELELNPGRQAYTKVWNKGKLSTDYDTIKYKYLVRHKWILADYVKTTADGAYYNITKKYYLVFYFYDIRNNVTYNMFGINCNYSLTPFRPLSPLTFFADLYKFIKIIQSKGAEQAYAKELVLERKRCRGQF